MKRSCFELVYHSTAAPFVDETALLNILEVSREKNNNLQISGCLLYHNQEFLQLIEGDQRDIEKLYAAIKNDSRHYNVSKLSEGFKTERTFPNWTMAFHQFNLNNSAEKDFIDSISSFANLTKRSSHTQEIFWQMVHQIVSMKTFEV